MGLVALLCLEQGRVGPEALSIRLAGLDEPVKARLRFDDRARQCAARSRPD
jgi:hypothetical protein